MSLARDTVGESATTRPATDDADDAVVLDDEAVLEKLESDLTLSDENYSPAAGIRNGVLIGMAIWTCLLIGYFVIFGS